MIDIMLFDSGNAKTVNFISQVTLTYDIHARKQPEKRF